uniref:Acyltransferase 3 domain-containing protein n=2 Tax=Chrysotila carterae TaxID=13221 RepID=A0A7S4BWC6_CHRCT
MAAALVLGILLGEADYQLHAPHLLRCALLVENWQLPWRGDVFWCPAGNTWTIVALLPSWGLYPLTAAAVAAAGATLGTVGLVAYACALWTVEMAVPFGAFLSQTFWLSSKQHEVLYFWPVAQLTDFVIGVLASEVSRRVVVSRAAEAAEAAEAKAVDRDVRVGEARSGDARSGGVRPPLCRARSSYGAWAALADASVLCVMFACFCTPWPGYRVGWEPFFDHGLVLPLSVFLCASACDERALCVRLLSHPALVSLGSYSFDVFLFQFPLKQLFSGLLFSSWTGEVFLLYLLTLWTIAGVYAETVEARAVAWLRRVSA